MSFEINRRKSRRRRQLSARRKINGTVDRPRLSVFRSACHIYLQIIDDDKGHTLAQASTMEPSVRGSVDNTGNIAAATAVGKLIAERAAAADIAKVVFDRGGCPYHGRVKAVAEAAREAGLEF